MTLQFKKETVGSETIATPSVGNIRNETELRRDAHVTRGVVNTGRDAGERKRHFISDSMAGLAPRSKGRASVASAYE